MTNNSFGCVKGFQSLLALRFNWGSGEKARVNALSASDVVRPPPYSTAQAVGLVSTLGTCPLVDNIVPKRYVSFFL